MFNLLSRRRAAVAVRPVRLSLESLDGRCLPNATFVGPEQPPQGYYAEQPTGKPPQITKFDAVEVGNGWVMFTGMVAGDNYEGMVISFGGEPNSLQGLTTVVRENGTFSVLVMMQTDGTDDGTATVVCTQNGLQSNVGTVHVSPSS